MVTISFALQAHPATASDWVDLARRAEALGFEALCIGDHPGSTASPFVALAAAAGVTSSLRLATAVANVGPGSRCRLPPRSPHSISSPMGGRSSVSEPGTPRPSGRWVGRPYPSPTERIARMAEVFGAVRRLLTGETVSIAGKHVHLVEAVLGWPVHRVDCTPHNNLPAESNRPRAAQVLQ